MSMVKVYTNFKLGYCALNIFIPCIVSLPIILIRKYISQKELLYKKPLFENKNIIKIQLKLLLGVVKIIKYLIL